MKLLAHRTEDAGDALERDEAWHVLRVMELGAVEQVDAGTREGQVALLDAAVTMHEAHVIAHARTAATLSLRQPPNEQFGVTLCGLAHCVHTSVNVHAYGISAFVTWNRRERFRTSPKGVEKAVVKDALRLKEAPEGLEWQPEQCEAYATKKAFQK